MSGFHILHGAYQAFIPRSCYLQGLAGLIGVLLKFRFEPYKLTREELFILLNLIFDVLHAFIHIPNSGECLSKVRSRGFELTNGLILLLNLPGEYRFPCFQLSDTFVLIIKPLPQGL